MVADFNKKRKEDFFDKKLLFKAAGVLLIIIIAALVVADIKIYRKRCGLVSQIESYKKQIEDIKKSNQTLQNEIANADNQEYLEKIAYEQLGQQKPGEQEVIFVSPEEKPAPATLQTNSWASWFLGVWQWIKNKF